MKTNIATDYIVLYRDAYPVRFIVRAAPTYELVNEKQATHYPSEQEAMDAAVTHRLQTGNFSVKAIPRPSALRNLACPVCNEVHAPWCGGTKPTQERVASVYICPTCSQAHHRPQPFCSCGCCHKIVKAI